jgi:hypothetical protein
LKLTIIILSLLLCSSYLLAQTYLPFHKQGKWGVLDDRGNVILSPKYAKIGLFVYDYAPVKLSLKWGVISKEDEIIVPIEYKKVELVRPDSICYFKVLKDSGWGLIDVNQHQLIEHRYEQLLFLDTHYFGMRNGQYYLGKADVGEICDTGYVSIENYTNKHFIGTVNSNLYHLLDSTGRIVLKSSKKRYRFYFNSILVNTNDTLISVFKKIGEPLLEKVQEIEIVGDVLTYKVNVDTNVLFDLTNHEELLRGQFDRALQMEDGFLIQKEDKWAIADSTGLNQTDWEYDEIVAIRGGYVRVVKDGYFGVLRRVNGKWTESLPCKYDYIYRSGAASLYSLGGKYGVLSLSGRKISNLEFDNIEVVDNGYKGYNDKGLTLISLSGSGELISKKTFTNVVNVSGKMSAVRNNSSGIAPATSLQMNGWFLDSIRSKTDTSRYAKKYGLNDFNDTIKVQPTYPHVEVGDKYSFAYRRRRSINRPKNIKKVETIPYYTAMDVYLNSSREKINTRLVYGFAGNDFEISNSGLILDSKGIHILDTAGNILFEKVKYMDPPFREMNRFCVSEKSIEYVKGGSVISNSAGSYWGRLDGFPSFENGNYFPSLPNIHFPEAKWGYMLRRGDLAFEPQFDQAYEYSNGHAMVVNGSKMGVVNLDSICVPLKYQSIQTIYGMNDTLVVTTSANSGAYQMVDSLAKPTINVKYQVLKVQSEHEVVLIKQDGKYGYINYDLSFKVEPAFRRKPTFYDDYLVIKDKQFGVYDHFGNELEADQYKEIERYENGCVVFIESKRKGVAKDGKVILPAKFKSIQFRKEYIRAEQKSKVELYNYDGTLHSKKKWNYADYNDEMNILIYGKKGKLHIKSSDKTFKRIFESDARYGFEDTLLVLTNKGRSTLETIYGKKLLDKSYTKITHFRDSLYWVYNGKLIGLITNSGAVLFEARYKKIIEIYPGIWGGAALGMITVKNESNHQLLSRKGSGIINSGNDMFIVVNGSQYVFMNRAFQNAFNEVFTGARPYIGGYAAVSVDYKWVVINAQGELMFEPCYADVEPMADNLFQVKERDYKGLWDIRGNQLLPDIYDQITKVNTDILQVIKDGLVGYVDYRGNWIYNPFSE